MKIIGFKELAKRIGLCPIKVENRYNINTAMLIDALFDSILDVCLQGYTVRIKGFGRFYVKPYKGRSMFSAVENKFIKTKPRLVMKFTQSQKSKDLLNLDENAFDKFIENKKRLDEKEKNEE